MTSVRLFTAIDIPIEIQYRLSMLGQGIQGARPVPRHQLHLTLKFIGEVPEDLLRPLQEILATLVVAPFSLSLQGLACLPSRRQPRIVSVGIRENRGLHSLFHAIEDSLAPLGIARDRRRYFPHVTLLRLKNPSSADLQRFLSEHLSFATTPFAVECFTLYSSQLAGQGAIHTSEGCYRLTG